MLFNTFSVIAKNSVIRQLIIKFKSYMQSWEIWQRMADSGEAIQKGTLLDIVEC